MRGGLRAHRALRLSLARLKELLVSEGGCVCARGQSLFRRKKRGMGCLQRPGAVTLVQTAKRSHRNRALEAFGYGGLSAGVRCAGSNLVLPSQAGLRTARTAPDKGHLQRAHANDERAHGAEHGG